MKAGLFKSGWQSESAEARIQALNSIKLTDQGDQLLVAELVRDDPERTVRQAALNKLSDADLLLEFSTTHPAAATRGDAELALSALIGAESELSEDQMRALLTANSKLAAPIAKYCPYAKLRAETAEALPEAKLAEIIASVGYVDTRQLIAEQLESEKSLQRARNLLRGKDKNAEKIIRAKLDALHAQQRQHVENKEAAELICGKMEHLASHEWRHEFKAMYSVWSQRWAALDFAPEDDVAQRYGQAAAKVAEVVEQKSLIETVHEQQHSLAQMMDDYCSELASLSKQQLIDKKGALKEELGRAHTRWTELGESDLAAPEIAAQFTRAEKTLSSVVQFCVAIEGDSKSSAKTLQAALKKLSWPGQYPVCAAAQEIQAEIDELKTEVRQAKETAAEKLDKLHKRINRLLGSTKRGDLKQAKRELTVVSKAAGRYAGKEKAALDERLAAAAEAVKKMSDWVDFATEPKYVELCEAMEALVESKFHADKLAEQIGELQKRWKALGHSESADNHWQRFKTAGDKAYEPCEVFFKKRREARRENLAKREPLIAETRSLLESTAWDDSPDYKKLESELSRIFNAWQKFKDVERGPGQKQWKKYSKVRSAIHEKLDVVYDANIELKNQLIAQVLAMLEGEIKEESLAKLQLYQNRWKQVGITRRKQDQAVWRKFKKATDSVYAAIQGLRKAKRADEDEQLQGYRQISREINHLAKTASDLVAADSDFDRLQSSYEELPELPRGLPEKLLKGLASDYQRACGAYSQARDRIKRDGKAKTLEALSQKAALCADLERLGADAPKPDIEKIQNALANIEINDRGMARKFEQRIAAALNADRDEANKSRRLLCIDLEILLGIDSPAEDASLRMQIQLERMKKHGIGQAQPQTAEALNELKVDWLCLPGAEPEIQKALDQRFDRLVKKQG